MRLLLYHIKEFLKTSKIAPFLRFVKGLVRRDTKNDVYDDETELVLKKVLRPDACCVDIGAHRGEILKKMIKYAPQGRHYAFEPLPKYYKFLKRTFPTVIVHCLALSDENTTTEFNYVVNDPGFSGLQKRIYHTNKVIIEKIQVRVTRLDDIIPKETTPAFIKIDTEGAEFKILKGGEGINSQVKTHTCF